MELILIPTDAFFRLPRWWLGIK